MRLTWGLRHLLIAFIFMIIHRIGLSLRESTKRSYSKLNNIQSFVKVYSKFYHNTPVQMSSSKGSKDEYAVDNLPIVLVPIADGTEEIEAVTIIDTLVRGGCKVVTASVGANLQVKCSRGVNLVADKFIRDCSDDLFDLIVCPGGMPGATNLRDSEHLIALLQKQKASNKLYGAICAAPAVVLASHGLLDGKRATCYPATKFQDSIPLLEDSNVVISENVVTSKGPGTSMQFALKLIEILGGKAKADAIAKEMITTY